MNAPLPFMKTSGAVTGQAATNPAQVVLANDHAAAPAINQPIPYFCSDSSTKTPQVPRHSLSDIVQPDRPIGYGAFGVVWSVNDPRDGKRVALKKLPNVFQSLVSSKRVFRELKMLCFFKHENVLSALDILQPPHLDFFQEIYVITELFQSDLHKIIVSPQHLSVDHIKVFLYQILRGLKYLHSARILHRDVKPGNLLVNSNCILKICDFGLARVEELDKKKEMTQEVVTQYYRAPEILMGARHYTTAVDIWSVGCIFGELLRRRIMFQAQSPIQQLDLITELLGTPALDDMRHACEAAKTHLLNRISKPSQLKALYTLGDNATHEAVHLLCQMLIFNPFSSKFVYQVVISIDSEFIKASYIDPSTLPSASFLEILSFYDSINSWFTRRLCRLAWSWKTENLSRKLLTKSSKNDRISLAVIKSTSTFYKY